MKDCDLVGLPYLPYRWIQDAVHHTCTYESLKDRGMFCTPHPEFKLFLSCGETAIDAFLTRRANLWRMRGVGYL